MNPEPIDVMKFDRDRLQVISDSVHMAYKNATEGDIAEFGIGNGSSLKVIAQTMAQCDHYSERFRMPTKHLHAFDSFQGFPSPTLTGDVDSPMVIHGVWGQRKPSIGHVAMRETISPILEARRLSTYPGYFSETLKEIPKDVKFACVNVDCDMYSSTREVLEELFGNKRLSDGCILLFDDYIENRASKAYGQRRAWEECKAKYYPDVTDLGPYHIGGWRFIVHMSD